MTHGGFRAGAGRKPRLRNKNAAAFGKLARDEAHDIVAALLEIATDSENEVGIPELSHHRRTSDWLFCAAARSAFPGLR